MTPQEICQYLGVPDTSKLKPEIIASMAETKVPVTDEEHIQAFRDFLKSGVKPSKGATIHE